MSHQQSKAKSNQYLAPFGSPLVHTVQTPSQEMAPPGWVCLPTSMSRIKTITHRHAHGWLSRVITDCQMDVNADCYKPYALPTLSRANAPGLSAECSGWAQRRSQIVQEQ